MPGWLDQYVDAIPSSFYPDIWPGDPEDYLGALTGQGVPDRTGWENARRLSHKYPSEKLGWHPKASGFFEKPARIPQHIYDESQLSRMPAYGRHYRGGEFGDPSGRRLGFSPGGWELARRDEGIPIQIGTTEPQVVGDLGYRQYPYRGPVMGPGPRPGRDPVIEALERVLPLPSNIGRGPDRDPVNELAYDPDEEGYFSNVIRDLASSGLFNAAARDTGTAKRAQEEKQYQDAVAMLGDLLGSMGFDLEED